MQMCRSRKHYCWKMSPLSLSEAWIHPTTDFPKFCLPTYHQRPQTPDPQISSHDDVRREHLCEQGCRPMGAFPSAGLSSSLSAWARILNLGSGESRSFFLTRRGFLRHGKMFSSSSGTSAKYWRPAIPWDFPQSSPKSNRRLLVDLARAFEMLLIIKGWP